MPAHRIPPEVLAAGQPVHSLFPRDRRPALTARLVARVRAHAYDRRLSVGVPSAPGSSLRAHRDRLISRRERRAVASTLRRCVEESLSPTVSLRIALDADGIRAASDLMGRIAGRLESAGPVGERGMARLRLLLSDGVGPLYRYGRGDLRGRLGAALAAL
ncbi:hypothetical protein PDG61_30155 [Mycolicibacterium sp. BiH015]|uniref:hypothetical protein n=1 Tax=Mycolicibacterium sp. BiH015 TaxID=3018808 RepID=UPI0022E2317F|nr:hypothetical protein [Mycolicibacterium sp. BiH015]MDA2895210.1 hypothetical protein [Mycolicibacterium sp. BiH015]